MIKASKPHQDKENNLYLKLETVGSEAGDVSPPQQTTEQSRRLRLYLGGMFVLCYFSWVAVHAQREFWAMSKKTIKQDVPTLSTSFFGTIDTGLFLTYAVAQVSTGIIGDKFNKRSVLTVSYLVQAVFFCLMGYAGYVAYERTTIEGGQKDAYQNMLVYFTLIFMSIGLVQSVDLPSLISVMGNWTHRGNRGFVTGLWSTCGSVGNILGLQLAPILLHNWSNRWYLLMFCVASIYIFIGVAMAIFLVPDPKEVGIEMEKEEAIQDQASRAAELSGTGYQPLYRDSAQEVQLSQSNNLHQPLLSTDDRRQASVESSTNHGADSATNIQDDTSVEQRLERNVDNDEDEDRIAWLDALLAPKVLLYAFTFFCIKFSIYAIMLWMPMCLSQTQGYDNTEIANILTAYEVATLLGTCILGPLTDVMYGKRSPVAMAAIICASVTAFLLTFHHEELSIRGLMCYMFALGFFLGSIYHIVNITCCADLGKEQRGKKATSTISGIIDGTGSLGTGIGMFFLGHLIEKMGYTYGFLLVVSIMITLTLIPLSMILMKDLADIRRIQSSSQ